MKNKIAIVIGLVVLIALSGTAQAMTFSVSIAGDGTLKTDMAMNLKTNDTYGKYKHSISAYKAEDFTLKQEGALNTGVTMETNFEYVREPVSLIGDCRYMENVGSGIMRNNGDCKACAAGAYANVEALKAHSVAEASPIIMSFETQMQGHGIRMAVGARSRDENGTASTMYEVRHGSDNIAFSALCERPVTAAAIDSNLKMICPWPKGRAEGSKDWRVFAQTNRS